MALCDNRCKKEITNQDFLSFNLSFLFARAKAYLCVAYLAAQGVRKILWNYWKILPAYLQTNQGLMPIASALAGILSLLE